MPTYTDFDPTPISELEDKLIAARARLRRVEKILEMINRDTDQNQSRWIMTDDRVDAIEDRLNVIEQVLDEHNAAAIKALLRKRAVNPETGQPLDAETAEVTAA